jgi:hypothetical protein
MITKGKKKEEKSVDYDTRKVGGERKTGWIANQVFEKEGKLS